MSKRLYREFYLLPRGEQRALILLSMLLILSMGVRITIRYLPEHEPAGMEEFEQEARLLFAALAEADSLRQARSDSISPAYPGKARSGSSKSLFPIDINRADSTALLPLPGIGPVFAGRIIKYRKLLGGFVSVDQLSEVYGLPVETIREIRSLVYIDRSAIRKIIVDSATFRELLRHPYLEFNEVKDLVEYRDFKKDISSTKELQGNQILSDSTLKKIDGYFDYR